MYVRTVNEVKADARLANAYARVRAARGAVANLHEAMSLRPDALEAFLALDAAVLHAAPPTPALSRRERELIGLVTSHQNKDNYGFTHHADAFGRYVTEPGLVALVAAGAWKTLLAPRAGDKDGVANLGRREAALAAFAAKLASSPSACGPADVDAMRSAGFVDEEIVDAVLVAAHVGFVNRVTLGLGVGREDADRGFRY